MLARKELTPFPDFGQARRWIRQCVEDHPNCSQKGGQETRTLLQGHSSLLPSSHAPIPQLATPGRLEDPILPTRVIDVGSVNGLEEPRLVLSEGCRAKYVALSHCWGGSRPLITDASTLAKHLQKIEMSTLPWTFRDAVIATRTLGYRFLWIDSLCILQDSPQDWQQECAKMAAIYQNAIITIAGLAASDCSAGFLQERLSILPKPLIWEYETEVGTFQRVTIRQARYTHDWDGYSDWHYWEEVIQDNESNSPIAERAWILQERLLPSRILYFGKHRMHWECNTHCQLEDACYPGESLHSTFKEARQRIKKQRITKEIFSRMSLRHSATPSRLQTSLGLLPSIVSNGREKAW
jgi:hypothetical protein